MTDLLNLMGGPDSGPLDPQPTKRRRKRQCTRDFAAGPGTCWQWWEGCPDDIDPCATRLVREVKPVPDEPSAWARENAGRHFLAFAIVFAPRYRTLAAAHAAWEAGVRG